jgi:hypothetical protein
MKHFTIFLAFSLLLSLTAGCNRNVPMSGRVTFADNGEPLTVGTVVFAGTASQARGNIEPDGTFQLGFLGEKDGLPKGDYKVYIDNANRYENGEMVDGILSNQTVIPLISPKFADAETSGLSITVDGSTNTFDIQVERPKK